MGRMGIPERRYSAAVELVVKRKKEGGRSLSGLGLARAPGCLLGIEVIFNLLSKRRFPYTE